MDYPPHPVFEALVAKSWLPTDVVKLVGYFGPTPTGMVRLYRSLDDLSEYVDIAEADIAYTEEVSSKPRAFYVWVRKEALVNSVYVQPASAETRFLEGEITVGNLVEVLRCLANNDEKSQIDPRALSRQPC
jgi:hypothetical protein